MSMTEHDIARIDKEERDAAAERKKAAADGLARDLRVLALDYACKCWPTGATPEDLVAAADYIRQYIETGAPVPVVQAELVNHFGDRVRQMSDPKLYTNLSDHLEEL